MQHPFEGVLEAETKTTRRSLLGRLLFAVAGVLGASATASAQVRRPSTRARGEEGGFATTYALGEEGGRRPGWATTHALGEEGGRITTFAMGEEGGWATTYAIGEEGGKPPDLATTHAVGEEGGRQQPKK